jgi:hypothetical protein
MHGRIITLTAYKTNVRMLLDTKPNDSILSETKAGITAKAIQIAILRIFSDAFTSTFLRHLTVIRI